MAKKNQESAALAKPDAVQMAEAIEPAKNWLGDALEGLEIDVTGTEEMDASDVRLPTWALNSKGTNVETNRAVPDDEFLNTVSGTAKPQLRLVVLSNHKSRLWRENGADNKPVTRCRSWDGKTGQHETIGERKCDGCADYKWTTSADGKRSRKCGDVFNLLAVDRETGEIGMLKVKKAAIKVFKEYYQRYFHKKSRSVSNGQILFRDNPLFAVETVVDPEKQSNAIGTWYTAAFTLGGVLPREEILMYAGLLRSYMNEKAEHMRATVEGDDGVPDVSDAIDTTGGPAVNPDEFKDDAGAGGNRF
jgi:hypothetical protein